MSTRLLQILLLFMMPLISASYCDSENPCEQPELIAELAHLCPDGSSPDFSSNSAESCEAQVGFEDGRTLESLGGVCRASGECSVLCRSDCPSGEVATFVDEHSLICGEAPCRPGETYCGRDANGPVRLICRADGQGFNEIPCAEDEVCVESETRARCAGRCPDPDLMYYDDEGRCRCEEGYAFDSDSRQCEGCVPDCDRRECGEDPLCGESCGLCDAGQSCQAGLCEECSCGEQECGQGPCELFCGTCNGDAECEGGRCVTTIALQEPQTPPLTYSCCTDTIDCSMITSGPLDTECFCVDLFGNMYFGTTCI